HFPVTQPPAAQTNLWLQQHYIQCTPGVPAFAWHDVEVQKIGPIIVYSIDGLIAATANSAVAGAPAGSYLTFLASDINGNASTDPNFTNLNFVVFDNIRVSNYVNVVSGSVTTPGASEIGPTPGVFTLTRSSAGVPLTVNFTLTGTATNGVQYQTVPTSVTFASTATSTNITITPIDDGVPRVPTSVILTILNGGANYTGAGSSTLFIADGDTPTIDITAGPSQMYERYASDYLAFQLTRRGRLTAANTVTLNYAGTAVAGSDYVSTNSILLDIGVQATNAIIYPIRNATYTGNKTIIATVGAVSGGGAAGVATNNTAKIIDSEYAPTPATLADSLTGDPSSELGKWAITYGTGDLTNHASDYSVDFGYDLSSASVGPAPGGNTTALHMTCNKSSGTGANVGAPGAVNVYYTNAPLSGNYAVRFNMNLVEGQNNLNTMQNEGAIFGVNHTGTCSNWWYSAGVNSGQVYGSDGVWYFVSSQFGGTLSGEYQEFTGVGGTNNNTGWTRVLGKAASSYTSIFKNNPGPFTSVDDTFKQTGGVVANGSPAFNYDASTWSDVEIRQINNIVTMSINHTAIFTYTNTTVWTNGYLMLGYADVTGNGQTPDSSVYYAN
ncbi:MAG TPA: Calx-beta domain-containing protein, partial [Verrucomicrobiae bacterium]